MGEEPKAKSSPNGAVPDALTGSQADLAVVKPLSKADPSVAPDWNDHVHEYFNQDAHPNEAVPMATHEAKE